MSLAKDAWDSPVRSRMEQTSIALTMASIWCMLSTSLLKSFLSIGPLRCLGM